MSKLRVGMEEAGPDSIASSFRQCRISHTHCFVTGVCVLLMHLGRVVMHSRVETPRHRQIGRWSFTQVPISPSHK